MSNYKKEDVAVLSLLAVLLVFNGYYASMSTIGPSSSTPAPVSASATTSPPTPVTVSSVGTTTPTPSTITSCDQIEARNFPIDPDNDPYNLDGDGDGIACEAPGAPAQHAVPPPPLNDDNTTTSTPGSSSSPFIEPPPPEERGQVNAIGNVTTLPTTANGTTKTDGLLTATINGTRFTANQTILINGTLGGGEGAGAGGTLFIELRDPRNEILLYDSTNMTTGSSFDTPFSYALVAGDLEKNNGGGVTTTRTVFKPMNETADNYTMVVGYDTITSSANNNNSSTTRSSEVQFAFAYEHVVARGGGVLSFPPSPATRNATTPSEPEPEPEPVQPPVQPPPTREPEPEPVPQPQPEEEEQEEEESEEEQLERLHELLQDEIDDEDDED